MEKNKNKIYSKLFRNRTFIIAGAVIGLVVSLYLNKVDQKLLEELEIEGFTSYDAYIQYRLDEKNEITDLEKKVQEAKELSELGD